MGVAAAMSRRPIPADLLAGVAESDQHAAELAFDINVERAQQLMAEAAKGGLAGILGR